MGRRGKLYLILEYMDKTLLEILEERTNGLDVRRFHINGWHPSQTEAVRKYIF